MNELMSNYQTKRFLMLAKAIELANAEVLNLKDKSSPDSRTVPYLMLTPAQRYGVAKRAAGHGVTASICYFAKNYLNYL